MEEHENDDVLDIVEGDNTEATNYLLQNPESQEGLVSQKVFKKRSSQWEARPTKHKFGKRRKGREVSSDSDDDYVESFEEPEPIQEHVIVSNTNELPVEPVIEDEDEDLEIDIDVVEDDDSTPSVLIPTFTTPVKDDDSDSSGDVEDDYDSNEENQNETKVVKRPKRVNKKWSNKKKLNRLKREQRKSKWTFVEPKHKPPLEPVVIETIINDPTLVPIKKDPYVEPIKEEIVEKSMSIEKPYESNGIPIKQMPLETPKLDSHEVSQEEATPLVKRVEPHTPNKRLVLSIKKDLLPKSPKKGHRDTPTKVFIHNIETSAKIQNFYTQLRPNWSITIHQPDDMISQMFHYQRRAVSWMVDRETKHEMKGGILADEMGLGKTVEVLGLILNNQRNDPLHARIEAPYGLYDSSATLIITPAILLRQWKEEIRKHCPKLNVWIYQGVSKLKDEYKRKLKKEDIFAGMDIILTSYEVLCKDFNYTLTPSVTTRRGTTSSEKLSTPLTKCSWWRICVDEAQMCSITTTQTAKMVLKMSSVNKWAISGTPIKKNFNDLRGLLVFLECEDEWNQETSSLIQFLKTIMWRHSKEDVIDEVPIPTPIEHEETISFCDFERFCHEKLKGTQDIDTLDHVVSTQNGRFGSIPFYVMSHYVYNLKLQVDSCDLYHTMSHTCNMAANEFYQSQISLAELLNKYGDNMLLDNCYDMAKNYYLLALELSQYKTTSDIYKNLIQLKTPSFVLSPPQSTVSSVCYHSLFNLLKCYKALGETKALEDNEEQVNLYRENALQPVRNAYTRVLSRFTKVKKETSRVIRNRLQYPRDPWWMTALHHFSNHRKTFFKQLRDGVEQSYDTKFHGQRISVLQLHVYGEEEIIDLLKREFKKMYQTRDKCLSLLSKGVDFETIDIHHAEDDIVEMENALSDYEMSLVSLVDVQNPMGQTQKRGELNIAERILLYIEYMTIKEHNPLMDAYVGNRITQEELKKLYELSIVLLMAESHFRELEIMKLEVEHGDRVLKEKKRYIRAMVELLGSSTELKKQNIKESIEKSVVHVLTKKQQLEFIVQQTDREFDFLDRYGTKLGHAARILQSIVGPASDTKEKALVFSAWPETLMQLSWLLDRLHIQYRFGKSADSSKTLGKGGTLKSRLEEFCTKDEIRVLFLNSLSQSTGLTLTQANHVLILDPIDLSSEDQAVGRAYRIGQRKNTHIYRFKVEDVPWKVEDVDIPERLKEIFHIGV